MDKIIIGIKGDAQELRTQVRIEKTNISDLSCLIAQLELIKIRVLGKLDKLIKQEFRE